jgi:hypothetical protein
MCSPFVADGTLVFVQAGDTLETMSVFRVNNDNLDSLVGTVDDVLAPWALEAALVSFGCFQAHGSYLCRSRFRLCASNLMPDAVDSRPTQSDSQINALARASLCRLPVFNSLRFFEADGLPPAHCDFVLNPLRLPPFCSSDQESEIACMNDELFDMLDGNTLLRQTSFLGLPLFGESVVNPNRVQLPSITKGFEVNTALQFVLCPTLFVKNDQIDAAKIVPFTRALVSESALPADVFFDNKFCVSPCPSFIFAEADYRLSYWVYVLPGMIAFVLNLSTSLQIVAIILLRKLRRSPSSDAKIMPAVDMPGTTPFSRKYPPDACGLVVSSAIFGFVGILPSAVLYTDLPCACDTEVCFQSPSVWCTMNRSSSFFLQMIIHCLAWKLLKLYLSLVNNFYSWRYKAVTKYGGRMAIGCPVICCVASYATEVVNPRHSCYALHFVRSAFTCRMRFPNVATEFLLHYSQIMGRCLFSLPWLTSSKVSFWHADELWKQNRRFAP